MARYKTIDTSPRFLPVDLERQLVPGSFEHALSYFIDHDAELSAFDARYRNDATGATAYPPAILLKIILFAYSLGIVSSRGIERACREHVTFIALSGDSAPHFTTIAGFVSALGDEALRLLGRVIWLCDRQGLIGRTMFAIDGVKLPANAAKARSGTRAEFERQAKKLESAARTMLERHRANDALPVEPDLAAKAARKIEAMERQAAQLRGWLAEHPNDRRGPTGGLRKSNRTDNDSAKMATAKGVIQGYTAVAAVDEAHQIIVEAQAHGSGAEQELLLPLIDALARLRGPHTLITADAGYHCERNIDALAERNIPALIADPAMRRRDERFQAQGRHKQKPDPLHDKGRKGAPRHYRPVDFTWNREAGTCLCPAGKRLYGHGSDCRINGHRVVKFQGALRDCGPCSLRKKCLRKPATTKTRQVAFFLGKADASTERPVDLMKRAIDSARGRALYGGRFATVEPVFGNLRHNKRLNRFTLRGRQKVDAQWKLYCMVHNLEKLAKHGYAQ